MKNVMKVVIVLSLIAVMLLSLVACGNKPSGEYEGVLTTLIFDGNDVTLEIGNKAIATGTFTVEDDGTIKIVTEGENAKAEWPTGLKYDKENDKITSGFNSWKKAD